MPETPVLRLHDTKGGGDKPPQNVLYYHSEYGDKLEKSYQGDAGYDLYSRLGGRDHITVMPHSHATINTGVYIAPPPSMWVMITSRSSTIQRGLIVIPGIIDNGWRGELLVSVYNVGIRTATIKEGDRLAQVILMNIEPAGVQSVKSLGHLPDGDRGTRGFGSTGR